MTGFPPTRRAHGREFIAEKGREPSRDDKLLLLSLYQRYKRIKSLLGTSDDTRLPDADASALSLAPPVQAIHTTTAPAPTIAPASAPAPAPAPAALAVVIDLVPSAPALVQPV